MDGVETTPAWSEATETRLETRRNCRLVALIGVLFALGAFASDKPVGTTVQRPPIPLDTEAMNAMLRADRDKDGVLSREELDHYSMSLGRRFKEVDADRDGKLTLYEFEKLLGPPETSASRR